MQWLLAKHIKCDWLLRTRTSRTMNKIITVFYMDGCVFFHLHCLSLGHAPYQKPGLCQAKLGEKNAQVFKCWTMTNWWTKSPYTKRTMGFVLFGKSFITISSIADKKNCTYSSVRNATSNLPLHLTVNNKVMSVIVTKCFIPGRRYWEFVFNDLQDKRCSKANAVVCSKRTNSS